MNELQQYTDLYRQHRDMIGQGSAAPLNALREKALLSLDIEHLPHEGAENYPNIDLRAMLSPDYGLNLQRLSRKIDVTRTLRCDIPLLTARPFMVVNDSPAAVAGAFEMLPEGITVGSMRSLAETDPEWFASYYGRIASLSNPLTALNTLLVQDGLVIRIGRGVRSEVPLQIVNILQNETPLMAVRRLLIVAEEDSEVRILVCDHTQTEDVAMAALETVEIFAGKGARLDYYNLEESTRDTNRLSTLYLEQSEESHVTIDGMTVFNGRTRNEYHCRFTGRNAELKLYGMGIEDEQRVLSTYSTIDHSVADCRSDELFKYTLDDEAKGGFVGRIHVAHGAERTEAYQSNRNIVTTEKARMESMPQLEIYNDDVKCSHGCAIGQLDQLQMFYMRTRGLDEATAGLLLKQAFMADVIEAVRLEPLRDRLRNLVERRYAGVSSACSSCAGCGN